MCAFHMANDTKMSDMAYCIYIYMLFYGSSIFICEYVYISLSTSKYENVQIPVDTWPSFVR